MHTTTEPQTDICLARAIGEPGAYPGSDHGLKRWAFRLMTSQRNKGVPLILSVEIPSLAAWNEVGALTTATKHMAIVGASPADGEGWVTVIDLDNVSQPLVRIRTPHIIALTIDDDWSERLQAEPTDAEVEG